MKIKEVGTPRRQLGKGDVIEVSEGTIVTALAAVIVYIVHQNVTLPTEIESAVMVLIYAGVRLAMKYFRDTRPDEARVSVEQQAKEQSDA